MGCERSYMHSTRMLRGSLEASMEAWGWELGSAAGIGRGGTCRQESTLA